MRADFNLSRPVEYAGDEFIGTRDFITKPQLLAAVSYYIIEKPLMGWGKHTPRIGASTLSLQARSGRCAREGGRGHEAAWSVRLSGVIRLPLSISG